MTNAINMIKYEIVSGTLANLFIIISRWGRAQMRRMRLHYAKKKKKKGVSYTCTTRETPEAVGNLNKKVAMATTKNNELVVIQASPIQAPPSSTPS